MTTHDRWFRPPRSPTIVGKRRRDDRLVEGREQHAQHEPAQDDHDLAVGVDPRLPLPRHVLSRHRSSLPFDVLHEPLEQVGQASPVGRRPIPPASARTRGCAPRGRGRRGRRPASWSRRRAARRSPGSCVRTTSPAASSSATLRLVVETSSPIRSASCEIRAGSRIALASRTKPVRSTATPASSATRSCSRAACPARKTPARASPIRARSSRWAESSTAATFST